MKRYISIILSVLLIVTCFSITAFAEDDTNEAINETEQTGQQEEQDGQADQDDVTEQNSDNSQDESGAEEYCRVLDKLLESVNVKMETSEDGKTVLIISFTNEKLESNQIMTEENRDKLLDKVLGIYLDKVNRENKSELGEDDVTITFEEIKNDEGEVENFVSKIIVNVPHEYSETFIQDVKQVIENEVKKILVDNTFETAKMLFEESRTQVRELQRELLRVRKLKDNDLINEVSENLNKARQLRVRLEGLKDELEAYKDEVKALIEEKEDEEEGEEDENIDDEDKDEENKDDKELKEIEKRMEKAERIRELIRRRNQEREKIIQKLQEKSSGKAAEKIEANTVRQTEKQEERLGKLTGNGQDADDTPDEEEEEGEGED
ncbi:MAG: hypothetical protein HPY74_11740 [Firmicutes bacterium]|nr:hypothetical protein [Bacillota bacterium]